MSDLEEALGLALRARDSWQTLVGTVVTWTHLARSAEAHRRVNEGRGASQVVLYATGVPEVEPPAEQEQRTSLWVALPDRARSETRGPGAPGGGEWEMTVVVHGDTFWMHHPQMGATTNGGDAGNRAGLGVEPSLLDPAPMVLGSAARIAGETTVAGRAGVVLHLEPRPASLLAGEPDYVNWTRSPVEAVLDADRGIALSLTLFIDGDPFHRAAFTEIAFDAPIPQERLTFTPPAGAEIVDVRESHAQHRPRPLHEIAAESGFVVLAARGLRPGWSVVAHRVETGEAPPVDEAVHLFYRSDEGDLQVNVFETVGGQGTGVGRAPDGTAWRTERRDGTDHLIWEPAEQDWPMDRQVVFEREGTRVQLMSNTVDVSALIAFAATFVPVAQGPAAPA